MWTWKRESLWLLGAIIVMLVCFYSWTHQSPQHGITTKTLPDGTVVRYGYIDPDSKPDPEPVATDWSKCLVPTVNISNITTTYNITLYNKCSVSLDPFKVWLKLYDSSDSRIGWNSASVSYIEAHEKIKWSSDFPVKEYPLTKEGISKITVYLYEKQQ